MNNYFCRLCVLCVQVCAECFCEQVCEWSAQWHSYIIALGSILLQVPKKQNLRCGFLFKWVIMRVLNKERREERRREAIYSKAKEKGDNCGLHTSFNLISTEPLDHELYPEGFYLFLYNHFFFNGLQEDGSRESFSLSEWFLFE